MADIFFLDFEIHLRDEARVRELQGNPPGETSTQGTGATAQRAIIRAPLGAAQEFGNSDNGGTPLPLVAIGNLNNQSPSAIPDGPYIFSKWFMMDDPNTAVANFPMDAATFVRKSGGLFGIPFLFPETKRFYWRGTFHYDAPLSDEDPSQPGVTRSPIMKRRFLDPGPGNMCGNREDTGTSEMSRAAGRWVDTFGFAVSGQTFQRAQRLAEYQATPAAHQGRLSWERLYIRLRQAGGGDQFWQCEGGSSGGFGARLDITPSGQIAAYNVGAGSPTLMGTSEALEVGRWYKVDLLLGYADGGAGFGGEDYNPGTHPYPGAHLRLFLDNVEQFNITPPATGLGSVGFHDLSKIGTPNSNSTMMLDIGFWMNAERPLELNGIDWLNGSRAVLLRGDSFDSDHDAAAWPGSVQTLAQVPGKANALVPVPSAALASATASGKLAVVTDADRALRLPGSLGLACFVVTHRGHASVGSNGQIGYRIANGADVLSTMGADGTDGVYPEANFTQTFPGNSRTMYRPSPGELPADLSTILPIDLIRVKANDGNTARTYALQAVAEVIGTFGDEDYPANFDAALRVPVPSLGVHNAPYPRTPWATAEAPPMSPVVIKTGTYVGTGTDHTLTFRAPVNFLWIRRHTNGNPYSARWFSSLLGPTLAGMKSPNPWVMPRIEMDPAYSMPTTEDAQSFQAVVRLAGTDSEVNEAGITYAYTAVSDPGMRFLLNGAMWHIAAALPKATNLIIPDFTPLAGIFAEMRHGVHHGDAWYLKSPGHAADALQSFGGVSVASGVTFGAGQLTHRSGLGVETWKHLAFALFRRDDGSGHAGVVRVFGMGSYVGNGVASRDILVSPVSERRPVFVVVVPEGNTGYYKDCHMPATEARDLVDDGVASTTAIIGAALNGFTVGSSLNTNGVTFHYLIIWGGETAGNGGMSQCGEFVPVPPDRPPCPRRSPNDVAGTALPGGCDPGGPEAPEDPDDDGDPGTDSPGSPGGGDDDMDTDLDPVCKPFTTRVADIALSRIGHSRRIVDLATDETQEALQVRLHWAAAVEQTLRDFPWPFATRYAALALISGSTATPVNRDWTYSYRQPSDCVFERRIVVVREGAVDPTPPPFALSFDGTGNRIFTNQNPATLEYTARPECTAGRGDPLFLDALEWKLAARLAPVLTRMPDKVKLCEDAYQAALAKAYDVIRPGNPGPRGTANAADAGAGHEAANVAIVNRALVSIGARTIANKLTEQSREAEAVRLIFEAELRSTLRDFAWPFATRYAEALVHVQGPAAEDANVGAWSATVAYVAGDVVSDSGTTYYCILANTGQAPPNATYWTTTPTAFANADWTYAYRLPTDCVMVRRIVREHVQRAYDPNPIPFRKGTDARGELLFTNEEDPTIEYTARINGVVAAADDLFREALGWRLAAKLAPSLAQVDPSLPEQLGRGVEVRPKERKPTEAQLRERATRYAWAMYGRAIATAGAMAANEGQPQHRGGDADWILGRQ